MPLFNPPSNIFRRVTSHPVESRYISPNFTPPANIFRRVTWAINRVTPLPVSLTPPSNIFRRVTWAINRLTPLPVSLFHPRSGMLLCVALLLFGGLGGSCALEQDPNPCCLKKDNSVALTPRAQCNGLQGLVLSKAACSDRTKILNGLCQSFAGHCFQENGSCVTDWRPTLKSDPPWYNVHLCMRRNISNGAFNCNKGRECFLMLQKGAKEVSIEAGDGNSFSTGIKIQSTSQSLEITITLNNKGTLVITFHAKPVAIKDYELGPNNTKGATLIYTDSKGVKHTSLSGRMSITKVQNNKATGIFQFLDEKNITHKGILTQTPLQ